MEGKPDCPAWTFSLPDQTNIISETFPCRSFFTIISLHLCPQWRVKAKAIHDIPCQTLPLWSREEKSLSPVLYKGCRTTFLSLVTIDWFFKLPVVSRSWYVVMFLESSHYVRHLYLCPPRYIFLCLPGLKITLYFWPFLLFTKKTWILIFSEVSENFLEIMPYADSIQVL